MYYQGRLVTPMRSKLSTITGSTDERRNIPLCQGSCRVADSAFDAGADGYLLKESTSDPLLIALDAIVRGETYLDAALESLHPARVDSRVGAEADAFRRLSERELEVCRLLAGGQNSKQIAALLGISSKAVDNHRGSIMTKLGLESIADLVRLAI